MQQTSQNLQSIYRNYKTIPLILSAAVVIDYALTFYLAGGLERILKYECRPTLVYAVEHGIVIPYLVFTVFFYYAAGYIVLKYLMDSRIYYIGVAIIPLMSITHVLGGLSWYVLNVHYSNAVLTLTLISVVVTIAVFGYEVVRQIGSPI